MHHFGDERIWACRDDASAPSRIPHANRLYSLSLLLGSGLIKNHETVSIEIERNLRKLIRCQQQFAIMLKLHPDLDQYLEVIDKPFLRKLAEGMNAHLEFEVDDSLHLNEFHFYSLTSRKLIET